MAAVTFDKLTYLKVLKASGISETQACAHAMALEEALRDTVATRHDLEIFKRDIIITLGGFLTAV